MRSSQRTRQRSLLRLLSHLWSVRVPQVATRKAYGMALAKLGRYNERMVVLDGDTKNSTFSELFKNEHPNRYVECYIAEQNMVKKAGHSGEKRGNSRRSFIPSHIPVYVFEGERGCRLCRAGP